MWISKVKNKATGKIYQQLQFQPLLEEKSGWND